MVMLMEVNTKKVEFMLSGYQRTIPKQSLAGTKELASFAALMYGVEAHKAKIRSWRGRFYSNFLRQQSNPMRIKDGHGVSVATVRRQGINYAIALDRMKPHWINLRKGRIITKWAKEKLKADHFASGKVFVRKHPYINAANRVIGRKVNPIMRKHIKRGRRRKGR